ncbi:MAG TPA: helicase-related protein [Candidatus Saccharimonadales bacterium]|nr:helicase-related protein [Candidatus Saccharimonadales bacterium]
MSETLTAPRPKDIEVGTTPDQLKSKLTEALDALKVLPAGQIVEHIQDKIRNHRVLLVNAEPGAGKSYVLPPVLLQTMLETNPNAKIIVSESRKNLVRQLGSHGKTEEGKVQKPEDMTLKDRLGSTVDFSNADHRASPTASIDFAVEQTLINRLIKNPSLEGYAGVMVDEAHRYMGILKPLLKKAMELNPNLRVIFATGTANAARSRLQSMFPEMEEIKIEGRKHVVAENWNKSSTAKSAPVDAAQKVEEILREGKKPGNILTFLAGGNEMDRFIDHLEKSGVANTDKFEIIKVMGKDKDTIERIKTNSGKRKIIVSTNALEEGVDPNCDIVIVSGWRKTKIIDPITGIEEWQTIRVSKDSAEQQSKRVGRKRPGEAHFLFPEEELKNPNIFPIEDRVADNLTNDVLALIAAGYQDIRTFEFEGDKDPTHIEAAIQRLQVLGALDKNEKLTEIGRFVADCETDPQYGRMLYEAEKRGCEDAVAILIGILGSDRSLFQREFKKDNFTNPDSDFISILEVWNKYVKIKYDSALSGTQRQQKLAEMESSGINVSVFESAAQKRRDLVKIRGNLYPEIKLSGEGNKNDEIQVSVLAGLIDKLLIRDNDGTYKLANGKKSNIAMSPDSGLFINFPDSVVSGKITHIARDGRDIAELNQKVDLGKLHDFFPYLNGSTETEVDKPTPESAIEIPTQTGNDAQKENHADEAEVKDFTEVTTDIEDTARTEDKATTEKEVKTFMQKIKENWHNLSERVKNLFRSFSERMKRLFGIK